MRLITNALAPLVPLALRATEAGPFVAALAFVALGAAGVVWFLDAVRGAMPW